MVILLFEHMLGLTQRIYLLKTLLRGAIFLNLALPKVIRLVLNRTSWSKKFAEALAARPLTTQLLAWYDER